VKKRLPTPEERRIWRESNRFTQKQTPDELIAEAEDHPLADAIDPPHPIATAIKNPKPGAAKALAPLAPLTPRSLKARGPIMATLDLHGLGKLDAYEKTKQFIIRQFRLEHRHVLIITGKGRVGEGVLRRALPEWLNEPALRPLVAGYAQATHENGGAGAWHVLLKKCYD